MSDVAESHTIRLLQEMRHIRAEVREGLNHVNERFDEVTTQIGGVTHMITLLAVHSSMLEDRVTVLEEGQAGATGLPVDGGLAPTLRTPEPCEARGTVSSKRNATLFSNARQLVGKHIWPRRAGDSAPLSL